MTTSVMRLPNKNKRNDLHWIIPLFLIGVFVFRPIINQQYDAYQNRVLYEQITVLQSLGASISVNGQPFTPQVLEGRKARYLEETEISIPVGGMYLHTRCGQAGSEAYAIKNDQGRKKFIIYSSMIPCRQFKEHANLWNEILNIITKGKDLPAWIQEYVGNEKLIRLIMDIIAGMTG